MRFIYGEAQQLAHLLAHTDGRAAVVMPEGFLFRTTGAERDYKAQLLRRGVLSAVIRLPRSAFSPYANVQTSLLLFETQGTGKGDVMFVDAAEVLARKQARRKGIEGPEAPVQQVAATVRARKATPNSAVATYEDIASNDFNISVDRYVRTEDEQRIAHLLDKANTVELIDIAEIVRPQSFPPAETEHTHTFAEVGLQDVKPDGSILRPTKLIQIDDSSLGRVMRQKLEPGDVLVSVRGRIGSVGIVPAIETGETPIHWLTSQAFVVVRLRNTSPIDSLALYRYLASPLGQGLLQSLNTGTTVPMISMGDLKRLRIMVPTAEERRDIERQYEKLLKLKSQITQLERLAEELNAASWPMTKISGLKNLRTGGSQ
jgi:type I restriction-modification system DNA methylase subunit